MGILRSPEIPSRIRDEVASALPSDFTFIQRVEQGMFRLHPLVHVALTVSDTHTVVEQIGRRELELGIVGVAGRHRGVTFEPFYRDEVVLAVPAGHKRAGKSMTLEELKAGTFGTQGYSIGLADNSIALLHTKAIPDAVWADLMKTRDDIIAGKVKVAQVLDAQQVRALMSDVTIGKQ